MPAGYSQTPLVKKLGLKEGFRAHFVDPPPGYFDLLDPLPDHLILDHNGPWDFVQLFVNTIPKLEDQLQEFSQRIVQHGMIWVSWHKKASKRPTELTEDLIRDTALALGMVDVKVCAIDHIWSGLKIVIRKENRKQNPQAAR